MHRIALRGVVTIVLAAAMVVLAGCSGPVFRVKVVNEGDFPLTAVRFVPFIEDDEDAQQDAFDDAVNLLRTDASGATIPVEPGKQVRVPHLVASDMYYVSVTCFVDGAHVDYVWEDLLALTELENNALLTMWVRCEYPAGAVEPLFTLHFEY